MNTIAPSTVAKNFIPSGLKPDVTDHAVLRYLERVLGMDVEATRKTIAAEVGPAIALGARSFAKGGVTYTFDRNRVVTVLPAAKPSEAITGALLAHGIQPRKGAGNRREAHQAMRRHRK